MIDPDLPDELQTRDFGAEEDDSRDELLAALGLAVAKKRDEAVSARKDSGIEAVWLACEEAYLCIDEMNRHEYAQAKWAKPIAMNAPVTATAGEKSGDGRSTAYIRMTARYVDMGAAKISEIILPMDDKPFHFTSTPVPTLVSRLAPIPAAMPAQMPGMAPPGAPAIPGMPQAAPSPEDDADDKAKKAEKRIYDWMVEAGYKSEMRAVIHDSAKLGTGVLKGPFPVLRKNRAVTKVQDKNGKTVVKVDRVSSVVPGYKRIDPWNCYPHGACGEDVNAGDYFFEKDSISPSTLKALKHELDKEGKPVYLTSQIDKVLEEGPDGHREESGRPNQPKSRDNFNIWYFTGTISKKDLHLTGAIGVDELPEDVSDISAIVTLVNNSVIRATLNPLQTGRFGYSVLPWSQRSGSWTGVGVAEQVSVAQKIVNNASRAVFNNAGVSGGVQIVMDPLAIVAANRSSVISPNKIWHLQADADKDVRKYFSVFEIPNITAQLMPIVQYGLKMAEEATNIPLISQGHDGEQTPQTLGQAQLQNTNANTLLRNLAYTVDEKITEPVVNDSYDWLLLDPDVPDDEKGDFDINCKGSVAMVEQAIQEQFLLQMGGMVTNPAFALSPPRWMEQVLKAKKFDTRLLQLTDAEKAQAAQQQPPEAPAVTSAKINAQARLQAAQIMAGVTVKKSEIDVDRDRTYVQAEMQRTQSDHQATMAELQLRRELAMMDYANKRELSLEQVKAKLADTTMRLNLQKDLSMANLTLDVHKHSNPQVIKPPTEPAGRAPDGEAYQA